MSDFKFHCPSCRQRLRCDEQLAGRRILCPGCQGLIVIPPPTARPVRTPPVKPSNRPPSAPRG